MIRVWALTRISESDREQGNSHEYQTAGIEAELARVSGDRRVTRWFHENRHGESFDKDNRGNPSALAQVLDGSYGHQFDELWIWDADRLCRDPDMHGHIRWVLRQNNQEIVYVHSKSFWERHIKIGISSEELITRRRRQSEGMKVALQKGHVCFRPPFGYAVSKDKRLFEVPEKVEVILDIHKNRNELGLRKMARRYKLSPSTIRYILNNPVYTTGEVRYGNQVICKVEPIIRATS